MSKKSVKIQSLLRQGKTKKFKVFSDWEFQTGTNIKNSKSFRQGIPDKEKRKKLEEKELAEKL